MELGREVQKRADSTKCRQLLSWCIPHAWNERVFRSLSTHALVQCWRQDEAEEVWRKFIFYSWSTWEHRQNVFLFKLWQITSPQCGYGKLYLTLWQRQSSTVCYTASGYWARHSRILESPTCGKLTPSLERNVSRLWDGTSIVSLLPRLLLQGDYSCLWLTTIKQLWGTVNGDTRPLKWGC